MAGPQMAENSSSPQWVCADTMWKGRIVIRRRSRIGIHEVRALLALKGGNEEEDMN